MPRQDKVRFIESVKDLASIAPAVILGLTAICFTIGLLIVNIRLARYGVYSSEFVRTEYILAGALYLVLVALADAALGLTVAEVKKGAAKWREKERVAAALTILFAPTVLLGATQLTLLYGSEFRLTVDKLAFWLTLMGLMGAGGISMRLFHDAIELWRSAATNRRRAMTSEQWARQIQAVVGKIPILLIVLGVYATTTYPYISPAWGGGRKDQVMLVATANGLAVSKKLNLPRDEDQGMVGPLDLLMESNTELIILPPKETGKARRAIRLNRDMFLGVVNTARPLDVEDIP